MDKKTKKEELIINNRQLTFQNKHSEKKAAELVLANHKLAFQNIEKEKRAAELIIANHELAFQNTEKEKRAAELIVANQELAFQNIEKEKRAAELIIANQELAFQNIEKEKRAAELSSANTALKKAQKQQKEYIKGLEEMMFMTSHRVRQPIANIIGLSNLLEESKNSPNEIKEFLSYIKQSAIALDVFTNELTTFICELEQKCKKKKKT